MLNAELGALSDADLPRDFEDYPRYKELTEKLVSAVISTPRDTKRIVGAFNVMRGLVGREVDWVDLFGFVVLTTKYPKTLELIRDEPERYVDNPLSLGEHMRRYRLHDDKNADLFAGSIDPDEDDSECAFAPRRAVSELW